MGQINMHLHTHQHSAISNPIFGIHGGGNIGLGCMADLVAKSPLNYHIFATSSDRFLTNIINARNQFYLRHRMIDKTVKTKVSRLSILSSKNLENISWLYIHSKILAVCLTEKALAQVSLHIANALVSRFEQGKTSLKILILMNKINSDQFVKEEIKKKLLTLNHDSAYVEKILSSVQFIPTVVDRIVSKIDKENVLRQIRKQLTAQFPSLKVKKLFNHLLEHMFEHNDNLTRVIADFELKIALFNAERDFLFYVPETFKESSQFPNMKAVSNLNQFAEIKNKFINGPHAMLAWMGGLMGCDTIAQAISHPSLGWFLNQVMEKEIAPILRAEYPAISQNELKMLKALFIKRCKASLEDPITRVGRDPLRKLNQGGRIRGVLELRQKHNLSLATPELERGIAAGVLYALERIDPNNEECKMMEKIFRGSQSYQAVLCYQGAYGENKYHGLQNDKDRSLIKNILNKISSFEKVCKAKRIFIQRG